MIIPVMTAMSWQDVVMGVATLRSQGGKLTDRVAEPRAGQSSLLSEKALFRMEIQLRTTAEVQPIRPTKNMTSRRYFAQIIRLKLITTPVGHRPQHS